MLTHLPRLILPALALSLALPCARAADAPPTMTTHSTTASLSFAPDGQSLWSLSREGELTIGTRDGRSVIYRGSLPPGDDKEERVVAYSSRDNGGELQVLRDGSFVRGTPWGALQWFEPPADSQPLRLKREMTGSEFLKLSDQPTGGIAGRTSDFLLQLHSGERAFGALAVSPGEKRVAYSYLVLGADGKTPLQAIVRVWNLSGAMEREQIIELRDDTPSIPRLAWLDDEGLVIGQGLSVARYGVFNREAGSEWKPDNAPQALGRANVVGQDKYLAMSPTEMKSLIHMALSFPFDVTKQKLLALSADGKQLLVCDGRKLVTLWDSTTGEARILSESAAFVPLAAKFSPDGTRVAAWDGATVRAWRAGESPLAQALSGERRGIVTGLMMIPAREDAPVWDVALTGDRLAWAQKANEVWSLPLSSPMPMGKRPVRLEDLVPYKPPVAK